MCFKLRFQYNFVWFFCYNFLKNYFCFNLFLRTAYIFLTPFIQNKKVITNPSRYRNNTTSFIQMNWHCYHRAAQGQLISPDLRWMNHQGGQVAGGSGIPSKQNVQQITIQHTSAAPNPGKYDDKLKNQLPSSFWDFGANCF